MNLLRNENCQIRTLYSLRHTYVTLELLENGTDIHTLAWQMWNSVSMNERHNSKLTAIMAAQQLARVLLENLYGEDKQVSQAIAVS